MAIPFARRQICWDGLWSTSRCGRIARDRCSAHYYSKGSGKTMPSLNDEQLKKVERALTEAHRSHQAPSRGADWTFRVMRDVRLEAGGHGPSAMAPGFDRLVWRTAA